MGAPARPRATLRGGIAVRVAQGHADIPITLYTAPDCGPCDSARDWLRQRSAPYQEIVVDTEVDAEEFKRRVGTTSVPVMTLGRTPHLGFKEGRMVARAQCCWLSGPDRLAADIPSPDRRQPISGECVADRPAPAEFAAPKS